MFDKIGNLSVTLKLVISFSLIIASVNVLKQMLD